MPKVLLLMLVVLTAPIFIRAQSDDTAPVAAPIPASVQERLAGLLPAPASVGAQPSGQRQFYSSDLYRYIDGAADAFLSFDLVAMVHQEYKAQDADITVDIYDLGTSLNAFGMYAAERSPSYHFVPVGAEGYVGDFMLNFVQGGFYVKLSAFGANGGAGPDLLPWAQAISARIGADKSLPAAVAILPAANRVAKSEKYVNKSPLGHDFLAPAMEATYQIEGKPVQLVISKSANPAAAAAKVTQLRDYFGKSGKVAPGPEAIAGSFVGSNKYEGNVLFFAREKYAVLCVNPPLPAEPFLREVLDHLARPQVNSSF
jgi:hypothetical protein